MLNWLTPSRITGAVCVTLAIAGAAFTRTRGPEPIEASNYALRTERILKTTPLIDGHNDLPYLLRIELQNQIYDKTVFTFREGKYLHPISKEGLRGIVLTDISKA